MSSIRDLLKRLINWFLGQSHQRTETLILEEHTAPGIRLIRLERKTQRAVATWKALFYKERFDLDIGLDTLEYVENAPPIERKNKLNTHVINVVKIYYDTTVDSNTGKRRIKKEVLLHEECCLRRPYTTFNHSTLIVGQFAKLFLKPKYHPGQINIREIFESVVKAYLGPEHTVYLQPPEFRGGVDWFR